MAQLQLVLHYAHTFRSGNRHHQRTVLPKKIETVKNKVEAPKWEHDRSLPRARVKVSDPAKQNGYSCLQVIKQHRNISCNLCLLTSNITICYAVHWYTTQWI